MYACCWAARVPHSPWRYPQDSIADVDSSLSLMEKDQTFLSLSREGLINSLTDDALAEISWTMKGKRFVNECDLCIALMGRYNNDWRSLFKEHLT